MKKGDKVKHENGVRKPETYTLVIQLNEAQWLATKDRELKPRKLYLLEMN